MRELPSSRALPQAGWMAEKTVSVICLQPEPLEEPQTTTLIIIIELYYVSGTIDASCTMRSLACVESLGAAHLVISGSELQRPRATQRKAAALSLSLHLYHHVDINKWYINEPLAPIRSTPAPAL